MQHRKRREEKSHLFQLIRCYIDSYIVIIAKKYNSPAISPFSPFPLLSLSPYAFQKPLNRSPYFGAAGLMIIDQYGEDE